jgi:hypothetical protein
MIEIAARRRIGKPIDDVWTIIVGEFSQAHKWAAGTTSCREGTPSEDFDRVCETETGRLMDTIIEIDETTHVLQFSVTGLPFFVRSTVSTWQLEAISDAETEIVMGPRIDVMPVIGTLMQIPMKSALNKLYPELLDDLAIYIETGSPSPRKQRELKTGS